MVEVPVYDFSSGTVGTQEVDESVFGDQVKMRLVRDAVVMYQANRRVGTHSTKTRGEVSGSQKKPWRQKGTGRARAGTRKSPIWRGGGITFGPRPRDYSYRMPRKALRGALASALLGKLRDGEVALLSSATLDAPKTKEFVKAYAGLSVTGSAFVVLSEHDDTLFKSARNLRGTRVGTARNLNAYEVVRHERLVMTTEALEKLVARCGHGQD